MLLTTPIMRQIIFGLIIFSISSACTSPFIVATLSNRNVYKTKSNLLVNKVYLIDRPTTDLTDYTIVPNQFPLIVKEEVSTTTGVPGNTGVVTKQILTTVPPAITTTHEYNSAGIPNTVTELKSTRYLPSSPLSDNHFIKYKVVADEGDYKYLKLLPGWTFGSNNTIIFFNCPARKCDQEDYIFRASKKDLVPNTHYLASSALIGKLTTIPIRFRKEKWNNNNRIAQGTLAIGYSFGWKIKLGNNPYQPHYVSLILYGAGVSQQEYFYIKDNTQKGDEALSTKTSDIAVTYWSSGVAYEFDKFNIGVFFGRDRMFGKPEDKKWVYQNTTWWGVGLGYDLFK